MKTRFNEKGFIGAIGDDLPSIIPIVIALLLFFSVFASTLQTYNQRNEVFEKRIEIISVARELKGNSMVSNVTYFQEKCDKLKIRPRAYSFMAAIYPANHPVTQIAAYDDPRCSGNNCVVPFNTEALLSGTDPDPNSLDPDNLDYLCEYRKVGDSAFTGRERDYLVRYYPVAVQTVDEKGNVIIIPAIMGMVVW